jgi:hypothetical protein
VGTAGQPPPLPGVDLATAPGVDDPGYAEWVESVALSAEGVDRSLVWASLDRTPAERLAVLERAVNDLLELRGGRWPAIR